MKQKRLPIDFYISKSFTLIILAITFFYLSGCAGKSSFQLAGEKASPELSCEYWNIQRVVSAIKHENGDISICVRLVNPVKTENPKLKTITLPFSDLAGKITAGEKLASSPSGCPLDDDWYPVEKAEKGCDKIGLTNVSSTTVLPIEKFDVGQRDVAYLDRNELYDLLNTYNKDQQITEKIYEVKSKSSKHALLVYWPAQINRQGIPPIIIAGTYEDKSTDAYYLLTIPETILGVVGFVGFFALAIYELFVVPFTW